MADKKYKWLLSYNKNKGRGFHGGHGCMVLYGKDITLIHTLLHTLTYITTYITTYTTCMYGIIW